MYEWLGISVENVIEFLNSSSYFYEFSKFSSIRMYDFCNEK